MENIYYEGQVMWAQVDANNHLRHSAYADMAKAWFAHIPRSADFEIISR